MNLAILLVLPVALADTLNANLTLLQDPDIWWHLADARLFTTTHHFIQTEPYSFSVAGERWINPEWLSELPYWFSFKAFDLRGLYLVTWLALGANLLLLYWRSHLNARNAEAAFWTSCIGFVLMTVNSGPRTIVFGYLAMSAELLILEQAGRGDRRFLWFLPPLFCLWINLHGSWLIGFALFALYVLCGVVRLHIGALEQDAFPAAERNRLLGVLAVSMVALFVNPYGWRLVWSPIDMMLNQGVNIANVSEWKPLNLGSLQGIFAVVVIALMVLANLKVPRKWRLYDLAVIFFAFYAGVDHVRFLFLTAVLITPLLAADVARSFPAEASGKTIPVMNGIIAAGALCFVAFMYPSEAKLEKNLALAFPLKIIESIDPAWRTFNWDYVGGRMAFESKPSLIDSRLDTFEHHGVLQNYLAAMNGVDSLAVLNHYNIDHVLILKNQPLAGVLDHAPGWSVESREVTSDGLYVLFAKTPATSGSAASGAQSTAPASR